MIAPRFVIKRFLGIGILVVIAALVAAVGLSGEARAQVPAYFWTLSFDFEKNQHGLLTMESGFIEDGKFTVIRTTRTIIPCYAVGNVQVSGGTATFDGSSYLRCPLRIGQIAVSRHGIDPDDPDTYGSVQLLARAKLPFAGEAPIFFHPDAQYTLDASGATELSIVADLNNQGNTMVGNFSGVSWNVMQNYTARYICDDEPANCDMTFSASGTEIELTNQGAPIEMTTGPTWIVIGYNPLTQNHLTGEIDNLVLDPGNFAH